MAITETTVETGSKCRQYLIGTGKTFEPGPYFPSNAAFRGLADLAL